MPTILVVDDDERIRKTCMLELGAEGYRVCAARDGREGLRQVMTTQPDLVVLDIAMPGMDGIEILSRLLRVNRRLPVILYTADGGYKNNYMTWAAEDYVIKSEDLTNLKQAVRRITHRPGDVWPNTVN